MGTGTSVPKTIKYEHPYSFALFHSVRVLLRYTLRIANFPVSGTSFGVTAELANFMNITVKKVVK